MIFYPCVSPVHCCFLRILFALLGVGYITLPLQILADRTLVTVELLAWLSSVCLSVRPSVPDVLWLSFRASEKTFTRIISHMY